MKWTIIRKDRLIELEKKEWALHHIRTEFYWFSEFKWYAPLADWIYGRRFVENVREDIRRL